MENFELADYLCDRISDNFLSETTLTLEEGEGDILWLIGFRDCIRFMLGEPWAGAAEVRYCVVDDSDDKTVATVRVTPLYNGDSVRGGLVTIPIRNWRKGYNDMETTEKGVVALERLLRLLNRMVERLITPDTGDGFVNRVILSKEEILELYRGMTCPDLMHLGSERKLYLLIQPEHPTRGEQPVLIFSGDPNSNICYDVLCIRESSENWDRIKEHAEALGLGGGKRVVIPLSVEITSNMVDVVCL